MTRIAPVFKRRISATNVVLPNELVLQIAHAAASSSAKAAKTLTLTCRALYHELEIYRFRAVVVRDPRRVPGLSDLFRSAGRDFISETVQAFWFDTDAILTTDTRWRTGRTSRILRRFLRSLSQIRVLAASASVIQEHELLMESWLCVEQLFVAYDGRYCTASMELPFASLTHLVLHAFRQDEWPMYLVNYRTLTHLAFTLTCADDEDTAKEWATAVYGLISDLMLEGAVPRTTPPLPLRRFLLVLVEDDNSAVHGFPYASVYAEALCKAQDARVRIAFDSKPCSWTKDWWLQAAQEYTHVDVWEGLDPKLFCPPLERPWTVAESLKVAWSCRNVETGHPSSDIL